MATTKGIINNFINGDREGKASSVEIAGDKLYNYSTVIAQRINGVIVLNTTRYSVTTSKHQNVLRRELPNAQTVENVRQGASDLTGYLTQAPIWGVT